MQRFEIALDGRFWGLILMIMLVNGGAILRQTRTQLPARGGSWLSRSAAVVFASLFLLGMAEKQEEPSEQKFFEISTGSTGGTYYPVGETLAEVISHPIDSITCLSDRPCGPPGLIAFAQASAGSVGNVRGIQTGSSRSGLAQADIVSWAANAQNIFRGEDPFNKLRVIANLYPESIHIVVRRGEEITTVSDLKGKRVGIDSPQSGTNYDARMILDAFGMRADDLDLREIDPNRSSALIITGELDAFFFVGGAPLRVITDLADRNLIDLVPISGEPVERLRKRQEFLQHHVIPSGTYAGVGEIETLSVGALWIVEKDAPEELVYDITVALWSPQNRLLLEEGHEKGRLMRVDGAAEGLPIALHPGSERFYRELGLLGVTPE